jgi:hypothetical protein
LLSNERKADKRCRTRSFRVRPDFDLILIVSRTLYGNIQHGERMSGALFNTTVFPVARA